MKTILTSIVIILFFCQELFCEKIINGNSILALNDTSKSQLKDTTDFINGEGKIGLNIKLGRKFPETNNYKRADGTLWYGIGFNYKLSTQFKIGSELNFWKSSIHGGVDYKIKTREILVLIYYNEFIKVHCFKILFGIGNLDVESNINNGNYTENLTSINLGGAYGINIINNFNTYLGIRRQFAGSIKNGGGSSYNSWLLSIIIELKI